MKNHNLNLKTNNKYLLKERAYNFSKNIIKFVASLPNNRIYWIISDQLLRAATSVGANIIEAQAASSKKDFIKFFQIALKSANETKYWLSLLKEATAADKKEVSILLNEVDELAKMLGASLITMKGKRQF